MQKTTCNAGDMGSIPGLGRFPGEGNGNPLQYSCLGNPVDRGAWWATVHGVPTVGHDLLTKPHYGFPQDIKCSSPCSAWDLVYPGYMHTFLYIQLPMFHVNWSWYVQWNMVPVKGRWDKKPVSQHEKIWLTLLWCSVSCHLFQLLFPLLHFYFNASAVLYPLRFSGSFLHCFWVSCCKEAIRLASNLKPGQWILLSLIMRNNDLPFLSPFKF